MSRHVPRNTASDRVRARFLVATVAVCWAGVVLSSRHPGIPLIGTVIGAIDGRPAEGVTVVLVQRTPGGQQILEEQVTTLSDGVFRLTAPGPGEYDLQGSRDTTAFALYGRDALSDAPQKWLRVTGPMSGITLSLWERPTLSGVVTDENGAPVGNASVVVFEATTVGGRSVLRAAGTKALTDAAGRYALQLWPRRYIVGAYTVPASVATTRRRNYYPNAAQPSAANPVELQAGRETSGIDISLPREPAFVVSGTVEGSTEWEGVVAVELFDANDTALPTSLYVARTTIKSGRFSLPPVVKGEYELRLVYRERSAPLAAGAPPTRRMNQRLGPEPLAPVPESDVWWVSERVSVVDEDVTLRLVARRGVRLSGRLAFTGSDGRLRQQPDASALTTRGIYLRGVDFPPSSPAPVGPARADGTFTTASVPPGRYVLGVPDGFEGYHLESVTVAGHDVSGVSFELTTDVSDAEIRFSAQSTTIAGTVAGKAGEERFVVAWPEDQRLWTGSGTQLGRLYRATTLQGPYTLRVLPGTYRVAARAGRLPRDWESPAFLRSLVPLSERVVVSAGQTIVHNPSRR